MPARLSLFPILAAALIFLPADGAGAQEVDICEDELARFESVSNIVVVGEPQRELEIEQLEQEVRQHCAQGDLEAAKVSLTEAWTLLLEETELMLPPPEEVAGQPCTEGVQNVQARTDAAQLSGFVQDAVGTLVVRAQQLCDEDRPADAQNKLAMAWQMLEQDAN